MADHRIKHTKDYRKFERSVDNRPLDSGKHKMLRDSMKAYGWIPSFPASCKLLPTGKLLVKDGQHRVQIAETLQIEIFYVVEEKDFDIAIVNAAQRSWSPADYVHRYGSQGSEDYVQAMEFCKKNNLPIGLGFALMAGTTNFGNVRKQFMSGEFKIKDTAWAIQVARIYAPLVKISKALKSARYIEACMAVCRVDDFDPDRYLRCAERCTEKLQAYSTRDAFLEMIESIYNHGQKKLVPLKIKAIEAMRQRCPATNPKKKPENQRVLEGCV